MNVLELRRLVLRHSVECVPGEQVANDFHETLRELDRTRFIGIRPTSPVETQILIDCDEQRGIAYRCIDRGEYRLALRAMAKVDFFLRRLHDRRAAEEAIATANDAFSKFEQQLASPALQTLSTSLALRTTLESARSAFDEDRYDLALALARTALSQLNDISETPSSSTTGVSTLVARLRAACENSHAWLETDFLDVCRDGTLLTIVELDATGLRHLAEVLATDLHIALALRTRCIERLCSLERSGDDLSSLAEDIRSFAANSWHDADEYLSEWILDESAAIIDRQSRRLLLLLDTLDSHITTASEA